MTFMVGDVQVVGIIPGNPAPGMTHVAIPADEIYRITEIIPVSSPITCKSLVFLPCFVERL